MLRFVRFLPVVLLIFFLAPLVSIASEKKVIIGFHDAPGMLEHDLVYSSRGTVNNQYNEIHALSVTLPAEEIETLRHDPRISYIEDDVVLSLALPVSSSTVPLPEYSESWGVGRIGAQFAHAHGLKGKGVKVAIIDTGIDYNHPELADAYKGGVNLVARNYDPYDDSLDGHGTHVAGVIAARDNGTGVVGVAPEASLYALKVLDRGGYGQLSDLVSAIEWAILNKMDLVNISSGTLLSYAPLKAVCEKAVQAGLVIVAAAGNAGLEQVSFPAAYEGVIAVNALDASDNLPKFSNYGAKVELSAPGVAIKSTVQGGGYGVLSGTSQAAPHVTGAIAVYKGMGVADINADGRTVDDLKNLVDSKALDLGVPGRDTQFGFGRVDLSRILTQTITLSRKNLPPYKDAKSLPLGAGRYVVRLRNLGLKMVEVRVLHEGKVQYRLSRHVHFAKDWDGEKSIVLQLDTTGELQFVPHGRPGTSAVLEITPE